MYVSAVSHSAASGSATDPVRLRKRTFVIVLRQTPVEDSSAFCGGVCHVRYQQSHLTGLPQVPLTTTNLFSRQLWLPGGLPRIWLLSCTYAGTLGLKAPQARSQRINRNYRNQTQRRYQPAIGERMKSLLLSVVELVLTAGRSEQDSHNTVSTGQRPGCTTIAIDQHA